MFRPSKFAFYMCLLTVTLSEPVAGQDTAPTPLNALEFREIGPVIMSGRVVDLAVVEGNTNTFYVASATGGVWKTTNNGVTFEPVFWKEGTHSVGAVAVHQVDTNVVWVGTGERANRQSSSWGDGIYRSTDGGKTWTNLGLNDSHHIGRIALHPTDSDVAYVAAMGHLWGPNEERALYVTRDGGITWTSILHGDENTGVVDVAMDPSDPNVLYAATYQRRRRPYGFHGGGPGSALFKSIDEGATWRKLTNGLPSGDYGRIGISIYRSDPNIVYISLEQGWRYNASTAYGERRGGVYRSEDKGETWEHMSDWNPRPMYASQPLVDPNNDQRIYMLNAYSVSDDGGRTFKRVPQRLHGDDRIVWVNPHDSRHVMKGDDGGLGISYDRGVTFTYATHLPISQYYRVSTDMRDPYWVYGGLQDNGSWAGPNATYRSEGIILDDWFRTGGGDGFANYVDTTDNRTLYTESQYLGLSRFDLETRQRKWIRPDSPRGAIAARRNWDAWGPGLPEPELANAMAPANWDGPFIISPHDTKTLYAGTDQLWKSTDQGDTWISLGDLTTGVNRRELMIMGERAHDSTLSLDDGIPYFPTVTTIAESPIQRGLIYAGTDDGKLHVSQNDGNDWDDVTERLPGLPDMAWISGVELSRHSAGTAYVVVNNYRNNDFTNYLYKTTNFGAVWEPMVSGLPGNRVLRTVREDPRNPNVLYLGSELGLFVTNDGGQHWSPFTSNLPTVAVNDLVVHPRDNDLILATHGRGIWILDQVNALQELTPQIASSPAHLFTMQPATMIRYEREKAHTGDMIFHGANPPAGAIVDYFLREAVDEDAVQLAVLDATGQPVVDLTPNTEAGIHRVVWNLRDHDALPQSEGQQDGFLQSNGPWVLPGQYSVRLTVHGESQTQPLLVRDDPRIDISDAERGEWHTAVVALAQMLTDFSTTANAVAAAKEGLEKEEKASDQLTELGELVTELQSRMRRLYSQVNAWPGTLTTDQLSQMAYYRDWATRLSSQAEEVLGTMP